MNIILTILGVVLLILFFLNIKSAADILCRIVGGFVLLFIFNYIAAFFSIETVGVNFLSSAISGLLGIPGVMFLFFSSIFL